MNVECPNQVIERRGRGIDGLTNLRIDGLKLWHLLTGRVRTGAPSSNHPILSQPGATWEGRELSAQLFRAGTRIGANYRAACRGRSHPDFVAKLGHVVEEADETRY